MDSLKVSVWDADLFKVVVDAEKKENQRPFKTYQSKDIQAYARVSKMQIINWSQQGAILPVADARGRGKIRKYDYRNLIEAMICRELNMLSIGIHYSKEVLSWLRQTKWIFDFSCPVEHIEALSHIKELTAFLEVFSAWEKKAPGVHGQKILSILKDGIGDSDPDRIREIIDKSEEPQRVKLNAWVKERAKMIEKLESLKFDKAASGVLRVKRVHTIWEYLRLYPSLFEFYLIISMDRDNNAMHAFIYDIESSDAIFSNKTSVIISLAKLISEAGDVHGEAEH